MLYNPELAECEEITDPPIPVKLTETEQPADNVVAYFRIMTIFCAFVGSIKDLTKTRNILHKPTLTHNINR